MQLDFHYVFWVEFLQQEEDTISIHLFGEEEEELKKEAAKHGDIIPLKSLRKQYPVTIDNVRSLSATSACMFVPIDHYRLVLFIFHRTFSIVDFTDFLAHLVFQPKSLIQSCFVHHHRWHCSASASASVHTSPWHMVRHRNFILGTHMHTCPPCMHIKYSDL